MNTNLWLITAKTNLHVGNENTSNYGIIDKAIQRDPLTNVPCINSSSLKGAINEFCSQQDSEKKDLVMAAGDRCRIFGSDKRGKGNAQKGEAIFYDAKLLFLPIQTNDENLYKYITSNKVLDEFESRLKIFGIQFPKFPIDRQDLRTVFSLNRDVDVNDDLFASCCSDEELPIIARNRLDDGTSSNLWYEQLLPSETVLFTVTQEPQSVLCNAIENKIVQIGANATIGYGYCEFKKLK